jgi:hypothetical protein
MYGLLPKELLKDLILDGYLGTYSNAQSPMKITFQKKNSVLSAAILTTLYSLNQ